MNPVITISVLFPRKDVTNPRIPASPRPQDPVPWDRGHFIRTELLWAYRGLVKPQHCGRWSHIPHTSAWFILRGSITVRTSGATCRAAAGEWLFSPPGDRRQDASEDCEILSICFFWQWIFGHDVLPLAGPHCLGGEPVSKLTALGRRLVKNTAGIFPGARLDLSQRSAPLPAHLTLQSSFLTWLTEFAQVMIFHGISPYSATLDPHVEKAVQTLDHPHGISLTSTELCRHLNLSLSQMNRLFQRDLGMTLHGYHAQRKLAAAHVLLITGGLSVKETATRLGFKSPQHFSRWFKARSKIAPSQFCAQPENLL